MAGRASRPSTRRDDDELIDDALQPVVVPPPGPDELPDSGDVGRVPGASYDPSNPSGAINVNNPTGDPSLPFVQKGETGGYLGRYDRVTRGAGESDTEESAARDYAAAIAAGVPPEFAAEFLAKNPHDENRLIEGYFSDAGVEDTRLGGGGSSAGGGGGSSGGGAPANGLGWMPQFTGPTYGFVAPTLEEAKAEPGYQFALQEGLGGMQNSAAAKGTLRGGATLKDLIRWGEGFGEQNYGNVYNRSKGLYDTKFGADYTLAKDQYAPKREEAVLTHSQDFAEWLAKLGVSKDIFNAGSD